MITGILLLAIVVFGLMVLFGQAEASRYYKFLIFLIFAPVLLAIGFNHVVWFWSGLPLWAQIVSVFLLPFVLSSLLRVLLPKAKWLQDVQVVLFRAVVYAVTFPFRLIWRGGRLIVDRERHRERLDPYRAVVGGRAPFEERSEADERW